MRNEELGIRDSSSRMTQAHDMAGGPDGLPALLFVPRGEPCIHVTSSAACKQEKAEFF